MMASAGGAAADLEQCNSASHSGGSDSSSDNHPTGGASLLHQQEEEECLSSSVGDNVEQGNDEDQNDDDIINDIRMELTEHERNLAILIREAVKETPELDELTDFMCAQLALICYDDVEDAMERALHIQQFRKEYAIRDTIEDAKQIFDDYMELFPQLHLSFTYYDDSYVLIIDNTCFDSKQIRTADHLRTMLGIHYYYCNMLCPDFDAIRNGAILVFECEGYDWKKNMMGFKSSVGRIWEEITSVYPVTWKKLKFFNPTSAMHIVLSMVKPFFPSYLKNKLEFCHIDSTCNGSTTQQQQLRRLNELYLVPTVEASNQRFMERVEETMKLRYHNERTFKL